MSKRLKRFGRVTEVELTVLGCNRLVAGLCRGYLPIHLAMDPVDPRHPMARPALIDLFVLIRVGHAGERELVVDGSRVLAKGVSQGGGHGRVVKRVALSLEERLNLLRKRIADGRQPDRIVLAATAESHGPVPASLLVCLAPLFEPVGRATSYAVLSLLVDGP